MKTPRIYADFNGYTISPRDPSRHAVPLDTFGTWQCLSNAGIRLVNGLNLVIYSDSAGDEDLEGNTIVFWDEKTSTWMAELDENGVQYVPRNEADWVKQDFHCFFCRAPLNEFFQKNGRNRETLCPVCQNLIITPIAPPDVS